MITEANADYSSDTLGGRIVHAREAQELTTSQLARRMGIKTETLNNWENDRAEPRPNRLVTLAGMLNISPTWLLTGTGEDPVEELTSSEMTRIRKDIARMRDQLSLVLDNLDKLDNRLNVYQSYQD